MKKFGLLLGLVLLSTHANAELLIQLEGRRRLGVELNRITHEVVVRELDVPLLFGEPTELQATRYLLSDEVLLRTLNTLQHVVERLQELAIQAQPYDEAMASIVCDPGVVMNRVCQETYEKAQAQAAPYVRYDRERTAVRRYQNLLHAVIGARDLEVSSAEAHRFLTDIDLSLNLQSFESSH